MESVETNPVTLMCLLTEAHAKLIRALGSELEGAYGLPLAWFDAMVRLRMAPNGQLTMTRLAGEVSLTTGGITRLVDRLVEAGYAERRNCPTDRRSVYVGLTPAGTERIDLAVELHRAGVERHLVARLDAEDRANLERSLRKLIG